MPTSFMCASLERNWLSYPNNQFQISKLYRIVATVVTAHRYTTFPHTHTYIYVSILGAFNAYLLLNYRL